MTALEDILIHGTESERELALLADLTPTKAEETLKRNIKGDLFWTLAFGAGAALMGYSFASSWYEMSDKAMFSRFWGGAGLVITGICSLINGFSLKDHLNVKREYDTQSQWSRVMPRGDNFLFYKLEEGFTYNPTPIEVRLGQRVYPVERFDEIGKIEQRNLNSLAYISGVYVREVSHENYEDNEPVDVGEFHSSGGERFVGTRIKLELQKESEVSNVDVTLKVFQFENGEKMSQGDIDRRVDDRLSVFYKKLIPGEKIPVSLLLSMYNKGVQGIVSAYPYQYRKEKGVHDLALA